MTKIPSVEEVKKMGLQKKQGQVTVYCYTQTQLENILINQRTALLTELREYTSNLKGVYSAHDVEEDIKAHINNLINPTK